MSLTFNPVLTTNAAGTFNSTSGGYIQGTAQNDPAVRNELAGGVLLSSSSLPVFGGVAISEVVPGATGSPNNNLGGIVSYATSVGTTTGNSATSAGICTGISVFDQANAMINYPGSPVPAAQPGMQVNFYRFGSGARIAVALAPGLVTLEGELISTNVSWDFTNQQIIPYQASFGANALTNATWASTGGGQATFTTTTSHGVAVGSYFTISGISPAGYNGDFIAITGTSGSTLVAALASNPGSYVSGGTLVAGGGAFPCRVLDVNIGNSMTWSYNSTTGLATWNYGGSAAVILI